MKKKPFPFFSYVIVLLLTFNSYAQTVTLLSEDFSTNTFATNGWNFPNGQPYWSINTFYTPTAGIAPNGLFFPPTTPTVANYNIPMASGTINASSVTGVVYFSCAIRLQGFNTSATGTEYMDVEYKSTSSATWSPMATFTNNLTGHNQNYAITNFILNGMAGQNFQVRFVARGANTYNIAGWGLDNIVITGVNCPASLPSITLSASSTSVCAGSNVTLVSAGGGPTFTWSPISSNSSSVVVTPTVTTSYALLSSFPGCTTTPVTAVTTITVYSNPSTLSVSVSTTTICSGSSVTLTANGSGTYTWSPSTAASSIVVSPTVSTVYTVTSTNSISCKNTGTVSVIVNPSPVLGVFSSTSIVCLGNTANLVANGASTYSWSTGSTGAIIAVTPTVNTVYTVTGTSTAGCNSSGTTVVNVNPPINLSTSATLVCSGSQVTLSASGANTYTWSNASSGASISVSPIVNTTYSVQGTDNVGCVSSRSIQLAVDITPTVSITNNAPAICKGAAIALSALGATNYTWSNATYSNINTVSPTLNTTYTVTGSSQAGCIGAASIATVTVLVKPNPTLTVNGPLSPVCSGKTVTLSVSGAATYSWSSGGNLANESITALTTAVYSVTGTNSVQCTSQNTVLVAVTPSPTLQISSSATAICSGSSATLLASGALTYTWNTGSTVNVIYVAPTTSDNYTISGTSQLLSVPYALHAKTAETLTGNITENDPVFGASIAAGISAADTAQWNIDNINSIRI